MLRLLPRSNAQGAGTTCSMRFDYQATKEGDPEGLAEETVADRWSDPASEPQLQRGTLPSQ